VIFQKIDKIKFVLQLYQKITVVKTNRQQSKKKVPHNQNLSKKTNCLCTEDIRAW
jgi:hypothetical protein